MDRKRLEGSTRAVGLRARGIVHSGPVQIGYTCEGHGAPLLLLSHDVVPRLSEALRQRYRVIAAIVPRHATVADLGPWLLVLVEGLGLTRLRLVVVGLDADLARIARTEIDGLESVAIVESALGIDVGTLLARLER